MSALTYTVKPGGWSLRVSVMADRSGFMPSEIAAVGRQLAAAAHRLTAEIIDRQTVPCAIFVETGSAFGTVVIVECEDRDHVPLMNAAITAAIEAVTAVRS